MAGLSENWLTEKHIDFEYKKYVLLAYLSEVSNHFEENKLYPTLSELIGHYRQVAAIRDNKNNIASAFPKRINNIDMEKFRITYEKIIEDDALMEEIENIVNFSIPQFELHLKEGKKIYDFIEEQLHLYPVGVMPLYPNEGYMMLNENNGETRVYEYQITLFEQPEEKYRGITTRYVSSFQRSFSTTVESIKNELLRANRNMPNPATYAFDTELTIPHEETYLPIAKRMLVKLIAQSQQ